MEGKKIYIPPTITEKRLDKILAQVYKRHDHALNHACPKRECKTKDKNNPWWTQQLGEMRKRVNKLYKKTSSHQNTEKSVRNTKNYARQQGKKAGERLMKK